MDTKREEVLLFKGEVFQIVGCAIEVLNSVGHGLLEKPYALVVEFGIRQIPFRQSRKLSGLNYLRITRLRVGISSSSNTGLEWERMAL